VKVSIIGPWPGLGVVDEAQVEVRVLGSAAAREIGGSADASAAGAGACILLDAFLNIISDSIAVDGHIPMLLRTSCSLFILSVYPSMRCRPSMLPESAYAAVLAFRLLSASSN
jgi:hypothetical protein